MNIIGNRIVLRAVEQQDKEILLDLINDPDTEKMIGGKSFPVSSREQEQWIDNLTEISRRIDNAKTLISGLKDIKGLNVIFGEVKDNECPLFVPVCVDNNRDVLRSYLIQQEIYMPIHWPISNLHILNVFLREIYMTEMSCVCDQRYTTYDMNRIVEEIKQFWRQKDAYSF